MSEIFSRRSYTLPSGREIPLPLGMSIQSNSSTKTSVRIAINIRGQNKSINAKIAKPEPKLIEAFKVMVGMLNSGVIPGTSLLDDGRGVYEQYHEEHNSFSMVVAYPCTELGKPTRKEFYVGTTNTKGSRYDKALTDAKAFRAKQLEKYREWFRDQLLETIEKLKEYQNENRQIKNTTD